MFLEPTRFDMEWSSTSNEPPLQNRARAMEEIYPNTIDKCPYDMPEPHGEEVSINIFVDADHTGNKVTHRPDTGIVTYYNIVPIMWYSKCQNMVETSIFGSKFIVLKIATELNELLVYKLRMFGVVTSGPSCVMYNNDAMVKSSSFIESTLKKKHCSIAFHKIYKSVVAEKLPIYYEKMGSNLADLLIK